MFDFEKLLVISIFALNFLKLRKWTLNQLFLQILVEVKVKKMLIV